MGGCIAIQVSARERRVDALVLLAAYTDLADYLRNKFRSRVPFLNEFGALATRVAGVDVSAMRTLDILKSSGTRPVFIIAGTADKSIPVSMSRALFQAAHDPKELWLVEGAGHGNVRDTVGSVIFDERVSSFLDKALFGSDFELAR
jgi:uncharacterized protein